jgi:catechol 2,3-dioxygenase-like lactoylglutathione lyase family enzyme
MALNHVAFSTHTPELTYKFYTQAMKFPIAGIETDDKKGNKYKHVFFDTGDGTLLAYYDLGAYGTKAHSQANTNVTEAMGLGPAYMHVAYEAKNREGLEEIRQRWLDHGLEVMEQDHHKEWMHSIYTFDPNGLMVECAYVQGELPEGDAKHAYDIFVEKKGIDEVGYPREGTKPFTLHLPNPEVQKPEYYTSITEKVMNMDIETAGALPFVNVIQH